MSYLFYGTTTMPKSQRTHLLNNLEVPGPGSYDFNDKVHHDLPKWSLKQRFDQGSCFQDSSITPGPGKYQHEEGFKKKPPMIISTKGERYRTYNDKVYSSSSLNLPSCLNMKGGFSFGYREPIREMEKSPGPVYHLDEIMEQKRTIKNDSRVKGFGGEKKDLSYKNDLSPGPGSFDNEIKDSWKSKTSEAWTFGSSKRAESMPSTDLGPGEYSPKISSTMGRSFKLRGRNEQKQIQISKLGPGSYDLPDTKTKLGAKFSSPKSPEKREEKQLKSQQMLSPSSYSPPRYLDQPTNQGYSLGQKLDENSNPNSEEPGPGSYQIAKEYVKGHGGYMGRKMQSKKKQNLAMDNFYKYDPNINTVARESPKFSFPQGKRYDKQNMQANTYSQYFYQSINKKKEGYSYSMGTAKRFAELKKESGIFKDRETDYSTIGQLPSYLKKNLKKK